MKKLLFRFFKEKTLVELIYLSDKGELSQRTVQINQWTNTCFKAYCYNKKGYRTFRIENVLSAQQKSMKNSEKVG